MQGNYLITISDDDKSIVFNITVPPFDLLTGIPAILSAISNLPPTSKPKRVRSDKGKSRKKVEATA